MTYFLHYFSVSSTVTIVSVDVDYYTCLYQMILTLDMYPRESYAEVLTTKKKCFIDACMEMDFLVNRLI
jgi:hypothetical protein